MQNAAVATSTPPLFTHTTGAVESVHSAAGTESAVVQELCGGASGLRPHPTPEQLRIFVQKAALLDAETLALELSQQLVNDKWQVRVRALAAIKAAAEAVSASGGDHPLALAVATLASTPETFDSVLAHSNPTVRQAARACAASLGFPAADGPEAQQSPREAADLLGGTADQAQQPASAVAADPLADLLGGDVPSGAPAGDSSNATANTAGAELDLLGGLESSPPPASASTQQQQPTASKAQGNASGHAPADMFAGLSLAPRSAQTAGAQSDDPFGGLFDAPTAAPIASAPAAPAASESAGAAAAPHMPSGADAMGLNPDHHFGAAGGAMHASSFANAAPMQAGSAAPMGGGPTLMAPTGGAAFGLHQASGPPNGFGQASQAGNAQGVPARAPSLGTRTLGPGPSKPRDAFDFVQDAMSGRGTR